MGGKGSSRRRKCALLGLALGQLFLVSMGALHVDVGEAGVLGQAAAYCSRLSGANNQYGFFSSAFEMTPRVVFEVSEDGERTTEVLESGASRDADARVQLTASDALLEFDGEEQRAVAASLAAKIFARRPAADAVVVRALTCDLPSMEAYREGARARWDVAYEATFVPRGQAEGGAR